MNLKKSTKVIIFIYLVMFTAGLVLSFFSGNIPGTDNFIIAFEPDEFTPGMEIKMVIHNDTQPYVYETLFKKAQLTQENDIGILITRFTSNGYKVFMNDVLLGQNGSMDRRNSNLWNDSSFFAISSQQIQDDNVIRIESVAEYKTGLTTHPVYITTIEHALAFKSWFTFFNSKLIFIGIGFLSLGATLLLIFFLMPDIHNRLFLYLAASMIFMAVYISDYTSFTYLPVSYFLYKKMIMLAFWTSSLFIGISIYRILKSKTAFLVSLVGWIGIVIIIIVSQDMIDFKRAYDIWYISQIVNIITWLIISLSKFKKSFEARLLFFGYLVLFVFALVNFYINSTGRIFSMNSPITYIVVLAIMPMMLAYFDYVQKNQMLQKETSLRKSADVKAYHDALTGTYNLHYFEMQMTNMQHPYTIVMLDFDNFKNINDEHGHNAGDEVLKHVTKKLTDNLREGDVLCRIGGDEFVILINAGTDIVKRRMEEFNYMIAHTAIPYQTHSLIITLSTGIFHVDRIMSKEEILSSVDKALYNSKHSGKNTVSVYEKSDQNR